MTIKTYKPMTAEQLIDQLSEMRPDAEVTISIDVSTYDGSDFDRAWGYELMGAQGNDDALENARDCTLLLRGEFVRGNDR